MAINSALATTSMSVESSEDELFRLTMESHAINNRVLELMTSGTQVVAKEIKELEVE